MIKGKAKKEYVNKIFKCFDSVKHYNKILILKAYNIPCDNLRNCSPNCTHDVGEGIIIESQNSQRMFQSCTESCIGNPNLFKEVEDAEDQLPKSEDLED